MQKGEQTEVIPVHGKDVPAGLLNKIIKRAGLAAASRPKKDKI